MTRAKVDPQPGIAAAWNGVCPRCDGPIERGKTRVVFVKGNAVHVECYGGGSDG